MDGPEQGAPLPRSISGLEREVADLRAELARLRQTAETERRCLLEAKAAQQVAEHRLELLLDSATDYAIVTADLERKVTSWNAGAERILGWKSDDILGRPCDIFYTPEDRAAGVPAREAATALEKGRARNERWHLRADGSRFFASGWTMPLRCPIDGAAPSEGLLLVMRDRTQERRAEEALRESEERYRHTVELSPQIPFTADIRGNIVDFNARWTVLTGMSREEAQGWGWSRAVLPADRRPVLRQWIHCLKTGQACDVQGRFRAVDGSIRWFRSRVYPRRDCVGAIVTWHGTLEDVSDRKADEQRMRALLELGDRLRDLRAPRDLVLAASGIIGQTLGAARVGYASVDWDGAVHVQWDWTDGRIPSMAAVWKGPAPPVRPSIIHALITSEEVVAVTDIDEDLRTRPAREFYGWMSVRAMLKVPVLVSGRVAAFIFVHEPTPRVWTPEEIAFARGAAERVWSALARSEAEVSQLLLTRELNHRVKNTLSVVQAMALQTVRRSRDLSAFGPVFQARLMALARAHDLLTQREWRGAPVGEVVRSSLQTAGNPRLDLRGCLDGEMLVPAQAVSLAMALHELFTNAIKHGALSRTEGSVCVSCKAEEDGTVQRVDWIERGGPAVPGPPTIKGFGMRLLERGLATQSGMTTFLDFAPGGLRCSLLLPRLHGSTAGDIAWLN
jgi:PAS domain S-box-containing protein